MRRGILLVRVRMGGGISHRRMQPIMGWVGGSRRMS